MPYYTRTYNPQPTTRVASTDLKNEFQAIDNALDAVETDVGKGIRAPEATTALPNAASRALKVLSFDSSGHPAVPIAVVDLANAVTAASNAATSETNAAASATAAAGSASTASTQASNASTSATNAASSASAASTSATSAATSASTATTQAINASTSATNAASSASAAATSATNAASSATTAGTHATNAGNSATAAATSASDAAASFDSFDDRYLGSKTSNPTLDNDGNALLTGALYWNSTSSEMRVWSGSAWAAAYLPASGYATLTGTETLTNKTLALGSNTVSGTLAQFNTAVTDADLASLAGTETLTNKTLTNYTEPVYAVTGTTPALSPTNGSIQTWTLSGSSTPTYGTWAAGQSIILMITAGANSITWPSTTWSKVGGGGAAPTLTSSGATCVILWKVGSTTYGALLGSV